MRKLRCKILKVFTLTCSFALGMQAFAGDLKIETVDSNDPAVSAKIRKVEIVTNVVSGPTVVVVTAEQRSPNLNLQLVCETANLGSLMAAEVLARSLKNGMNLTCRSSAPQSEDRPAPAPSASGTTIRRVTAAGVARFTLSEEGFAP